MAAYVIVDMGRVEPEDKAAFKSYVECAPATIEQYGGRYLARGGKINAMEGDWSPWGVVIAEFPDMDATSRWFESPEYAKCLKIREGTGLHRGMICVDGATDSNSDEILSL